MSPVPLERLGVLGLLVLAAALRLYRIDVVPPGLWFDEGANLVDALHVLRGELAVFFPGNYGREPLYMYLTAAAALLLGPTPVALRLVSVTLGVLTVVATYYMTRELFNRRVALLTAFLLATSFWHVLLSRLGLRPVALPLFEALAVYFLCRASRRGSLRSFAAGGLSLGLCLYAYLAGRATPVWFAALALGLAVQAWRSGSVGRYLRGLAVLVLTAILTAVPLAVHFATHPEDALERMGAVTLAAGGEAAGPSRLAQNALLTVGMLLVRGDDNPRHNLPDQPVFDPLIGAAFLLGLAICFVRIREVRYLLLPVWLLTMLAPGALSEPAPHFLRTVGIIPIVYVLPALGLSAASAWLARLRRPALRLTMRLGLAAVLAASAGASAFGYFAVWASSPSTRSAFLGDAAASLPLAQDLARHDVVLLSSRWYRDKPLPSGFLPGGTGGAVAYSGLSSIVIPERVEGAVYYVYPTSLRPYGDLHRRFLPAASVVQSVRSSDGEVAALVYRLPGNELPRPRPSHPTTARLGQSLEVLGYDLDRSMPAGGMTIVTIYARVLPREPGPGDWRLTLTMVDGKGRPAHQTGSVDALSIAPWPSGSLIVTWLEVHARSQDPPGLYDLKLRLHDALSRRVERAFDSAGRELGDAVDVGHVHVAGPSTSVPRITNRIDARLGDGIVLLGYDLQTPSAADEDLRLTLHWLAAQPVAEDLTVFVHVVDPERGKVGQQDNQPQAGGYPTSRWRPGETFRDEYRIRVAPEARERELSIDVGMYRLADGGRLPVRDAAGRQIGDHLEIPVGEARYGSVIGIGQEHQTGEM